MTGHAVPDKQSLREWCNADWSEVEVLLRLEVDDDTGTAHVLYHELVPEAWRRRFRNAVKSKTKPQ